MCIRDRISEILRDVPDDFAVFAGSASFLMPSLVMGAKEMCIRDRKDRFGSDGLGRYAHIPRYPL